MNKKFIEELMDDIGNKLREDYDIEPCTDNSRIDLEEIVTRVEDALNNYKKIDANIYYDIIHTVIEDYLIENNIEY